MIRTISFMVIVASAILFFWSGDCVAEDGYIRYCMVRDLEETNSITPFNQDKDRATPMEALLVAVKEGERPMAQVYCGTNGPVDRYFGPIPKNEHYQIQMMVVGGEQIAIQSSKAPNRWAVPVSNGTNRITVIFRDAEHPQLGDKTLTMDFQAYVYTIRPAGKFQSPFDDPRQNITHTITDGQGNLYAIVSSDRLKVLARFNPDGSLAARYNIGTPHPEQGHQLSLNPLFVDDRGHLYAEVHGNLIEYDKAGAFVRTLGTFDTRGVISTAADLAHDAKRESNRDNPSAWQRIQRTIAYAPVVIEGAAYFLAEVRDGGNRTALVRYRASGEPEVVVPIAGDNTPYRNVEGMALGHDGKIHIKVSGSENTREILSVNPNSGKVVSAGKPPTFKTATPTQKRLASVAGNPLIGMDGGGYFMREGFYMARDFSRVTARPLNTQGLRYRYILDSRSQWKDRITGETAEARTKAFYKHCWVHRGEVYVLYNDMQIVRFSPVGGAAAPAPKAVKVAAVKSDVLEISRVGGEIMYGTVLDGRTPLELEVRLTDGEGKPRAGVTLEETLWQRLPQALRLEWISGPVTDGDGRARLNLHMPRVTRAEMEAGKWAPEARLTIVANGSQAQARIPLYGVMALNLAVQRSGFAPVEALPLELVDPRGGMVRGKVVFRLGASIDGGQVSEARDVPVRGALVRLGDADGRILAQTETDTNGEFLLPVGKAAGINETVLPEPLLLTAFDPDTEYFVERTRNALQQMAGSDYGYDVIGLRAALLPQLVSDLSAVDPADVPRVRSRLIRLGLLITALREADDLARHSGERFAESLVNVMGGLAELADPLGDDKLGGLLPSGGGNAIANKLLAGGKGFKGRMAQWVFSELEKNFTALAASAGLAGKEVAWYWVKKLLMQAALDTAGTPWKRQLVDGLMEGYRKEVAPSLALATNAWKSGTFGDSPQTEQAIRARYASLAEDIRRASERQLDLDLYKADIDLGFDVLGQGLVVLAAVQSGPAAAEQVSKGVDLVNKGLKTLTTGADAYVGFQWLMDYEQAMRATADFSRAALAR